MNPMKTDTAGVAICEDCQAALEIVCPNGHTLAGFTRATDNAATLRQQLVVARREVVRLGREHDRLQRGVVRLTLHNQELASLTATRSVAVGAAPAAERAPRTFAAASGPRKPAVYKPRVCRCGAEFTPTGPRDARCARCRAMDGGTGGA
jgi:hypothetical protein